MYTFYINYITNNNNYNKCYIDSNPNEDNNDDNNNDDEFSNDKESNWRNEDDKANNNYRVSYGINFR